MAINTTNKEKLAGLKQPSLSYAPVEYSREYQDSVNNLHRLYYTAVDGFANALLDSQGTHFLSAPYGAFQDTTTQTLVANTPTTMKLDTVDYANGVSIVGGSRITVEHSGIYNLQWSAEFQNASNAIHDISVWLRKDGAGPGVDIPGSRGVIACPARKSATPGDEGHNIFGWNYFVELQANEFVELWWTTDSALVTLAAYPAITTPYAAPGTASVVVTMTYVSRL
jgi:hypothetical protein